MRKRVLPISAPVRFTFSYAPALSGLLVVMGMLLGCPPTLQAQNLTADTTPTSTAQMAMTYLDQLQDLEKSEAWPGIEPALFLKNIRENISHPLGLYEGNNTNFCGYAALSYLLLHDNPLGYAKLMMELYREGRARYGKILFEPSPEIREAAGKLKFKGALDIRPAEQLWFLCLADHFKGYLNLYNRHYHSGDEDNFWAAVNYGKFNRMVRNLLNYRVVARGSDLIRPSVPDLYDYISEQMKTGTTVLYLNNANLYKKNHDKLRWNIPTHYVILLDFERTPDGLIRIIYWDYGLRTLQQLKPEFLRKNIFGITHCLKKTSIEP